MPYVAVHHPEKCHQCGICTEIIACPGADELICIGCGACVLACPHQALELVEVPRERKLTIEVNGNIAIVPERITVKEALKEAGYPLAMFPEEPGLFAPCEVGGCGSCIVEVDGVAQLACRTIVSNGMRIKTALPQDYVPRRIIMNFTGHPAGGVGTPRQVRSRHSTTYIEAICFAAGCNFRCPQCQNWPITYTGRGEALSPKQAAQKLSFLRAQLKLNRMAISGGESTLNRAWLIQFVAELKRLNPDPDAHFHVDTNGSLITHDYIDELIKAGMTDIGIDLKALETDTFMCITGLKDRALSERYKETAWEAVRYLRHNYSDRVFTGVGIPYNRGLISTSEIGRMGQRLLDIDPAVQITLIDYLPAFRSNIDPPSDSEMMALREMLQQLGLRTVLAQTTKGNIIGL
jgi:pyruvate formate lyase activating enzyme